MIILDEPKYPVLDKAPSISKTVGNFNLQDYTTWATATGVCFPLGYIIGAQAKLPKQTMWVTGGIGALAGFMLAYQQSAGRLLGLLPNDKEVNIALAKRS